MRKRALNDGERKKHDDQKHSKRCCCCCWSLVLYTNVSLSIAKSFIPFKWNICIVHVYIEMLLNEQDGTNNYNIQSYSDAVSTLFHSFAMRVVVFPLRATESEHKQKKVDAISKNDEKLTKYFSTCFTHLYIFTIAFNLALYFPLFAIIPLLWFTPVLFIVLIPALFCCKW